MRSAYRIVSDHYAASAGGDLAGMMAEAAPGVQWTEMAGLAFAGTRAVNVKRRVFACQWAR